MVQIFIYGGIILKIGYMVFLCAKYENKPLFFGRGAVIKILAALHIFVNLRIGLVHTLHIFVHFAIQCPLTALFLIKIHIIYFYFSSRQKNYRIKAMEK